MRSITVQFFPTAAILSALLLSGCSLTRQEQLESSLRRQEATIRELEQQLASTKRTLLDQEEELQVLKEPGFDSPFRNASSSAAVESRVAWGAVRSLRIHRLTSGTVTGESDGQVVNLTVQPVDHDGEVVKVAGEFDVRIQRPGDTTELATLQVSSLQSRDLWNSGIVARGFMMKIPLPADASNELSSEDTVLVTVTLDLGGDRQYSASELIRIHR